jgi:hypothetical protein
MTQIPRPANDPLPPFVLPLALRQGMPDRMARLTVGLLALIHMAVLASLVMVLWSIGARAQESAPQEPAACGGDNLLERMRASGDPRLEEIETAADEVPNGSGKFWRIAMDGRADSYLYGTMHVSDPRVIALQPEVADALGEVGTVVIETDELVRPEGAQAAIFANPELTMFTDGTTLKTLLEPEDYALVEAELETIGVPIVAVQRMKPWMIASLVALPDCEMERKSDGAAFLEQADRRRRARRRQGPEGARNHRGTAVGHGEPAAGIPRPGPDRDDLARSPARRRHDDDDRSLPRGRDRHDHADDPGRRSAERSGRRKWLRRLRRTDRAGAQPHHGRARPADPGRGWCLHRRRASAAAPSPPPDRVGWAWQVRRGFLHRLLGVARSAELHHQHRLVDQVSPALAPTMWTPSTRSVSLSARIFTKPSVVACIARPAIRREGELADLVGHARRLQLFLGLADRSDFGLRIDDAGMTS